MSAITTHVLDTALGRPAAGVAIRLERAGTLIGSAVTDADGRARDLLGGQPLIAGEYELVFDTGAYFSSLNTQSFYPRVGIRFTVRDAAQHYHVPLLLSPFGYSTYRGS